MKKYNDMSTFKNVFIYLVEYINNNSNRKLNVVFTSSKVITTKVDLNMFYNSGQLLMLLYICSIKKININCIKYNDNIFYINGNTSLLFQDNIFKENTTSREIIDDMIKKSVYYKEFLPGGIKKISNNDLSEILSGFEEAYNIIMNGKLNLLKSLDKYKFNDIALEIIKSLKQLNPNDMRKQLSLIDIKLNKSYKNLLVDKLISIEKNSVIINKNILDFYIQNSIIGHGKYGIELMWMRHRNNKLESLEEEMVYMALILVYIGCKEKNMYYIENSKNCINAILNSINYKKAFSDDCLELIYIINKYIKYEKLSRFIIKNCNIFNKFIDNESYINIDNVMSKFINESVVADFKNIVI